MASPRARRVGPRSKATAVVAFVAGDPTSVVARALCREQLERLESYERGTRAGTDIEHLHKMRVATRRLRAALATFKGCFERRVRDKLRQELSWLAGVLGEVRDLDVHLAQIEPWQQTLGAEPAAGWARLREVLEESRDAARKRLIAALDEVRYQRLLKSGRAAFAARPPSRRSAGCDLAVAATAAKVLKRRVGRLRRTMRQFHRTGEAQDLHRVRIAGKRLRYSAELFAPLFGKEYARALTRLRDFQDLLGRFQDHAVAGRLVSALAGQAEAPPETATAYLFVLGEVAGASAVSVHHARRHLERALEALGGITTVRTLHRMAAGAARGRA